MKHSVNSHTNEQAPHRIDAAVRQQLDSDAEQISTDQLRARVLASLRVSQVDLIRRDANEMAPIDVNLNRDRSVAGDKPLVRPLNRWWPKTTILALSVALFAYAFFEGRFDSTVYADAVEIVRAAKQTHADPLERIYQVTTRSANSQAFGSAAPKDVRVHVQGDRFWVEMNRGDRSWVWGRDQSGTVWLVTSADRAMKIEADEVGPVLEHLCSIYGLQTETLLNDVLKNCRVVRTDFSDTASSNLASVGAASAASSASNGAIDRIVATRRRRGLMGIQSASLDVDRQTRALRSLKIERSRLARWSSVVEFTLVESRTADEAKYWPEGHVKENAVVMTRNQPRDRRRELLASWLGAQPDRWILP